MRDPGAVEEFSENDVLLCDRAALGDLKRLDDTGQKRKRLKKLLSRSNEILASRRVQPLDISFPDALPVSRALSELRKSVEHHQVTIVCGGTGSGKSTQIPKLLLQMGFGLHGQIAHTQPRRIAARAVAERIANETQTDVGEAIGSQVRFDKKVSPATRLKVMTDGILLEEIRNDKLLTKYDAIIIDEVHERSSNIDFALGYIAKILPNRPELKIVLMSATVDNASLLSIFDAKLVDVQGKQFPVTVDYRPIDLIRQSEAQAIDEALRELKESDDVLVFLPGEREINETLQYLQGRSFRATEFLPLYGRLSARAQSRVFEVSKFRKVILATNVAETSITIPGIRHVIDTGLARTSRYNPRSKLLELPIAEISQAAAKQRAGRCGREAPGRCIRLYAEENFDQREQFTKPEILRTNLASAILRCETLKLGKLSSFPLPDKPSPKLLSDGTNLLKEIGALDREGQITALGRQVSRLSADPRLARFLIAAAKVGQLTDALTIAAALTAGDCRVRPVDNREAADKAHEEYIHRDSDLLFFVNLWQRLDEVFKPLSTRQKRKYCESRFLSWQRLQQWRDMRTQLAQQCLEIGLRLTDDSLNYKKLHSAFVTAFASLIGAKNQNGDYSGARGVSFKIHPRSSLTKRKPSFVVCLEMFETSARYAQIAAKIDAAWVQKAAPHLVKCSYSSPDWDRREGRAVAMETQRIFGIKLRSDRKVSYVSMNPAMSRALFIAHGLVDGQMDKLPTCVRHNRAYIKALKTLEPKLRRSIAPDDDALYEHYEKLLPGSVVTQKSFNRWVTDNPEGATRLHLQEDDEVRELRKTAKLEYPDKIRVGELLLDVKYSFEPMSASDGMTFSIHEGLLARLKPDALDLLCPGLLIEKLTLLTKSLPKAKRKKVSPIAEFVNGLHDLIVRHRKSTQANVGLHALFSRYYQQKTGDLLDPDTLKKLILPNHLQAHVKIICEGGRDATPKRTKNNGSRFYSTLSNAITGELGKQQERRPHDDQVIYTTWCFGEVNKEISWEAGKNSLVDYQALVDRNSGVELARFVDADEAEFNHLHGVARLASLAGRVKGRTQVLAGFEDKNMLLMCASLNLSTQDLAQIRKAAYAHVLSNVTVPRTPIGFDKFMHQSAAEVEKLATKISLSFAELIPLMYRIRQQLDGELMVRWPGPASEISTHLTELLNGEMLSFSNLDKLSSLSRYATGIQRRIDRLQLDPNKDKQKMLILVEPLARWRKLSRETKLPKNKLCDLRYELEELIVNQFAPELSVSRRLSLKQINQELAEYQRISARGT